MANCVLLEGTVNTLVSVMEEAVDRSGWTKLSVPVKRRNSSTVITPSGEYTTAVTAKTSLYHVVKVSD